MNYHSSSKQLTILRGVIAGIAKESVEKRRVEIIFEAVAGLGFKNDYFFSVFIRVEEDAIQLSYARGRKQVVTSPCIQYSS